MKTIGHHTCKKDGGIDHVLKEGPFLSEYFDDENDPKYPFLGSGYYYWDDNKDLAHWWGKKFYKNDYFIIESEINLPNGFFLDLVGNRAHQKWFIGLKEILREFGYEKDSWTVGSMIEYAKKMSKLHNVTTIFPYRVIRAIDMNQRVDQQILLKFAEDKRGQMNLNPKMIICMVEKNENILMSKKIVHASV